MLLTLVARALRPLADAKRPGFPLNDVLDLPQYAREVLGVHGLNLATPILSGLTRDRLEALRERADKAGSACLVLMEPEPLALGDPAESVAMAAIERARRVIRAAQVLGCNAISISPTGPDDPECLARTVERTKRLMDKTERLDLNVLIAPGQPLTTKAERVTEIIKKVGGFRVGTLPDFHTAVASADPVAYLRRLAPYASAVCASTEKFVEGKTPKEVKVEALPAGAKHQPFELKPLVEALGSVGYDGTLGLDWRGGGDATVGLIQSRVAMERLLGIEPPAEPEEE